MKMDVKPLAQNEFPSLVDYFLKLSPEDDQRMCVDRSALPTREEWIEFLTEDSQKPLFKCQLFYLGWYLNDELIGHSGINKIIYGEEAFVHLHIWPSQLRKQGLGGKFLWMAIQFYFEKFELQKIICEPNADNIGPNKTLSKIGFTLIDSYQTKPSPLNYEHKVNRYEMNKKVFSSLLKKEFR